MTRAVEPVLPDPAESEDDATQRTGAKAPRDPFSLARYIMPGKQIMTLELEKLTLLLEQLKADEKDSNGRARVLRQCQRLTRHAVKALDARVSWLPFIHFSNDDYAWGVIRTVKRELMAIVGVGDLMSLLAECSSDLSYVEGAEQTELRNKLKHVTEQLEKLKNDDDDVSADLRNESRSIAIRVDQARKDFWWKVNDYKIRMLLFAVALAGVLSVAVGFLAPQLSEKKSFLLVIVLLGALGGLLGGLLRSEDVKTHLGVFFLNRVHALLSPILGACGALAIYLLLKSGLIATPANLQTNAALPYYFAIAFFSGFSERLLLRLMERGLGKFEPQGRREHKAK